MSRLMTQGRASLLIVAVLAVTFGAISLAEPGRDRDTLAHIDASAWLASTNLGTVQLVDGTLTAEQGAVSPRTLTVARPGASFAVVQHGAHALVVNHDDGTVRRVDGAVEQVSPRVQPFESVNPDSATADPDATIFAGRTSDTVWVYSGLGRQVQRLDPTTLGLVGDAVALAGAPRAAVVGPDGSLWAYDLETGEVKVVSAELGNGRDRVRSFAVADRGHENEVRLVGTHPVVIDRIDRRIMVWDGPGDLRQACDLEIESGDDLVIGAAGEHATMLPAVDTAAARLFLFDGASRSCDAWELQVGAPGDSFGAAVEARGHVYVPNQTDGRVYVVDLADPSLGALPTAPVVLPSTDFELLTEGDTVFFNDPTSARAGLILDDLDAEVFEKFVDQGDGSLVGVADQQTDGGDAEVLGRETDRDDADEPPQETPDDESVLGENEAPARQNTDPAEPDRGESEGEQPDDSGPDGNGPDGNGEDPNPDPDPDPEEPDPDADPSVTCSRTTERANPGDEITFAWAALPTPASVDPASVTWDFDDGADPRFARQVTHTFAAVGTYDVTVTVVTTDGVTLDDTCAVTIVDGAIPLDVDFAVTSNSVVANAPVGFQDLSTPADPANTRVWEFEGGSPEVAYAPVSETTWSSPGSYTVRLTVTTTAGETATSEQTVVVEAEPVVTPPPPEISLSTPNRTPTGSSASATIVTSAGSWSTAAWSVTAPSIGNAPDPSTLVGSSIAFGIDAPGDWVVSVTVTDAHDQTATASATVRGYIEPTATIQAPIAVSVDSEVTIRAVVTPDPGVFRWNVDGASYVGEFANPIQHTFTSVGPATVSLSYEIDGIEYSAPSVTVDVSESTVTVPGVVGLTTANAQTQLSGAGLTAATGPAECSASSAEGTILEQSPAAGAVVLQSATVTLTPNSHASGWTAPDLVGQMHAPGGAHSGYAWSTQSVAAPGDVGRVLGQSPAPGTFACDPQPVSLVVGTSSPASITCNGGIEYASCSTTTAISSINWGDGTSNASTEHGYGTAGSYTVSYTDTFGQSAQTQVAVAPAAGFTCDTGDGGLGSAATCTVNGANPAYTYSWIATASGDWAGRSVSASGTTWSGNTSFGWGSEMVAVTITLTVGGPGGTSNQVSSVRQWTGCG